MSSKSVSIQRPGGRPGAMIGNKAEKLKNPKETMGRLFSYIGSKKISLVLVLLYNNNFNFYTRYKVQWRDS